METTREVDKQSLENIINKYRMSIFGSDHTALTGYSASTMKVNNKKKILKEAEN